LDFFLSGFNVDLNITFEKQYSCLCGIPTDFIQQKIIPFVICDEKENLLKLIIENYDGYCFHPKQEQKLINPTLLLYFFDKVQRNHEIPEKLLDEKVSLSENAIKFALKCENHQEILKHLIIENSLKNEKPFSKKLDLQNLQKESAKFIDYLFYVGALTYIRNDKTRFTIPNILAREEYINEIISVSDLVLQDDSIKRFQLAVKALLKDKNIDPLCDEVKKHKLSHLKFNDVEHSMEQDVKTGFLFALSLAGQKIESECIAENKYADLFLFLKEQKIHIEFKNVKTQEIIQYSKIKSWQELTEKSKDIDEMTNDDVMNLKLIIFPTDKTKNVKNQNTINEYFSKKNLSNDKIVKDKWNELINQTKENKKIIGTISTKTN